VQISCLGTASIQNPEELLILEGSNKQNWEINLKIGRRKMIIGFFGFLGLILLAGCSHAASVDVDGWTFSADLGEQWRSDPQNEENGDMVGWSSTDGETPLFRGVKKSHAFWLAQEGSVFDLQDFPNYPHPK